MNNKERIIFEKNFSKLVNKANYIEKLIKNKNTNNFNFDKCIENTYMFMDFEDIDENIKYIYNILKEYTLYQNPNKKLIESSLYIKYEDNVYKLKISNFGFKEKYFIKINNLKEEFKIINYHDLLIYLKEQNINTKFKNINFNIIELLNEGLSKEKIEQEIQNILYIEEKNSKQKVKTLQK